MTLRGETATVRFDGRRQVLSRLDAVGGETLGGERWSADGVLLWIQGGEPSVTIGDQVLVWGCRPR